EKIAGRDVELARPFPGRLHGERKERKEDGRERPQRGGECRDGHANGERDDERPAQHVRSGAGRGEEPERGEIGEGSSEKELRGGARLPAEEERDRGEDERVGGRLLEEDRGAEEKPRPDRAPAREPGSNGNRERGHQDRRPDGVSVGGVEKREKE